MDQSNLPPAAKLAALIEAGRAANPDLKQGRGSMCILRGETCAMGFALLGACVARQTLMDADLLRAYQEAFGRESVTPLEHQVTRINDDGASLDEIILSLREGELAKVEA